MDHLPLPLLAGAFCASAALVWVAGIQLSNTTDEIDALFGLGEAVGGLILLAVATNLPEIAIVSAAAVQHNFEIATGNILGGIAIQTVVLVALDGFGVPRRPLTNATASLVQVLEGTLVIAVLAVAIGATLLPGSVVIGRVDPSALLILFLWVGGLWLVRRAAKRLPWKTVDPPDASRQRRARARKPRSSPVVLGIFAAAAGATLFAGVGLEVSGNALANQLHVNGAVFGGTFLAAATALPELSTGLAAVRLEDFELAVSDIFGGNAFLPVLFFPATLLAGVSVLGRAHKTDAFLAVLGILLTAVYVAGLVIRPKRQFLRLGPDSLIVLILYAVGISGMVVISRAG